VEHLDAVAPEPCAPEQAEEAFGDGVAKASCRDRTGIRPLGLRRPDGGQPRLDDNDVRQPGLFLAAGDAAVGAAIAQRNKIGMHLARRPALLARQSRPPLDLPDRHSLAEMPAPDHAQ